MSTWFAFTRTPDQKIKPGESGGTTQTTTSAPQKIPPENLPHSLKISPIKTNILNALADNYVVIGPNQMRRPHQNFHGTSKLDLKAIGLVGENTNDHSQSHKNKLPTKAEVAAKVETAMLSHLINMIELKRHTAIGKCTLDLSYILDTFRQYKTKGSFNEQKKLRDLSIWLEHLNRGFAPQASNSGSHIARALVQGLRANGFHDACFRFMPAKEVIQVQTQHGLIEQTFETKKEVIEVTPQKNLTTELNNLNPKTKAAIQNKVPSWLSKFS